MKKIKALRFLQWIILMLGSAVLISSVLATFLSNFNLGTVVSYLYGGAVLACGIFFEKLSRFHALLKVLIALAVAVPVVFTSSLLICGKDDTVTYKEDAIIVLGSGIRGETVGNGLRGRLDSAIEYHSSNPDAFIIVSGGQGPQEAITEALAMERYLLGQGIPQDKIIKEEKSTSTTENFKFSKKILDEMFGTDYKIAFVTTDYHIYRAENTAHTEGYESVTHCHSDIEWYVAVPSLLREMLAVMKMWVFD